MEKRCPACGGGPLTSTIVDHPYVEGGVPNVTLLSVEARTCPDCAGVYIVIPLIAELHAAMQRAFDPTSHEPIRLRFVRAIEVSVISAYEGPIEIAYACRPDAEKRSTVDLAEGASAVTASIGGAPDPARARIVNRNVWALVKETASP